MPEGRAALQANMLTMMKDGVLESFVLSNGNNAENVVVLFFFFKHIRDFCKIGTLYLLRVTLLVMRSDG